MRRRVSGSEAPPAWVLSFDGSPYRTYDEFDTALGEWQARREAWAAAHGVDVATLPADIPDAPFNPEVDL